MASQDWLEKDFYDILGVPQDADAAAIKKAYRKLARKYHPDKNPGDSAAEQRFKDVGEANSVLSDPKQREEYDQIRAMTRGGARFTAGGPTGGGGFDDIFSAFGGGGGGQRVRFGTGGQGGYPGYAGGPRGGAGEPDIEDLLSQMFGGAGGGAGRSGSQFGAPRGPRRGQDVQARTTLTFRQAVEGETVSLQAAPGRTIKTRIPAGVRDGQQIRLRGKGEPGDQGAPAGDLLLTVAVTPDEVYGREGDNLTIEVPVTFAEATLGATVAVPTLDGGQVKVKVRPGTSSGSKLRVKGRGVHRKDATGDLIVTLSVVVPEHLSDEARAAVETLARSEADVDPRAELMSRARG